MDLDEREIVSHRPEPSPGVLYIVGTPIGNLRDLSPRAEALLKRVSTIACEDTRHSGRWLKSIGVNAKFLSFYKHNTEKRLPQLLKKLEAKESIALISDAGMPGISDPGQKLVSAAKTSGYEVICIPGPCAAITALVSSGLPTERFCFEGFLPAKSKERKQVLQDISLEKRTSIIYESPNKLIKLLNELNEICGENRPIQISRELTKRFEEQIGPTIGEALSYFLNKKPIGEFTIVLGGAPEVSNPAINHDELLNSMKQLTNNGLSINQAAKIISNDTNYSKRFLYELAHTKTEKDS